MKYLDTPITCMEISLDGINVRVQFMVKNENRITVSYIQFLTVFYQTHSSTEMNELFLN